MAQDATLTVRLPGIDREFKIDEWIHGRLYSRVRIPSGQSANVVAFSYVQGQTVPTGGAAATERDTNMGDVSKLPIGWQALIFSHQIDVEGDVPAGVAAIGVPIADVREMINKTVVVFKVGRNPIYETAIHKLPSGGGAWAEGTANNFIQTGNGVPDARNQAAFLIPLNLREGKPFSVEARFPQAVSLTATSYLMHWLEGLIQRPFDQA